MKNRIIFLLLPAFAILFCSLKKEEEKVSYTRDEEIVSVLASDEALLAEAGKLAQTHTSNYIVQDLAEVLVNKIDTLQRQIMAFSSKHGLNLDASVTGYSSEQLEKLRRLYGREFDTEFTKLAWKTEKKLRKYFWKEYKNGDLYAMKDWAYQRLLEARNLAHTAKVCHKITKK